MAWCLQPLDMAASLGVAAQAPLTGDGIGNYCYGLALRPSHLFFFLPCCPSFPLTAGVLYIRDEMLTHPPF
jgi:hypothetical protein